MKREQTPDGGDPQLALGGGMKNIGRPGGGRENGQSVFGKRCKGMVLLPLLGGAQSDDHSKLMVFPAAAPCHVMAKPAGGSCNLDCSYCFYTKKSAMYPGPRRMSHAVLEQLVREMIGASPGPEVAFSWQGGEPTLMGLPFFEYAVVLQEREGQGRRITNAMQTNGTLLDNAWGAFLAKHRFLVGTSIDGPPRCTMINAVTGAAWVPSMTGCAESRC